MNLKTLYELKLWDTCDKKWISLGGPKEETIIKKQYNQLTKNGTIKTSLNHGDFYKIFKVSSEIKIKKVSK